MTDGHYRNDEPETTRSCGHCLHHTGESSQRVITHNYTGTSPTYELICCHCGMIFRTHRPPLQHGPYVPNHGVQPTAELAGRESVAADPITERQPAAADA